MCGPWTNLAKWPMARRRDKAVVSVIACAITLACTGNAERPSPPPSSAAALPLDSLRCVQVDEQRQCTLLGVSLLELIVNPREYDGRRVRVVGFAHFEFESNRLYLSESDWKRQIPNNGVGLVPPETGADSLNNRDVLVEATFSARHGGGLHSVTRIERAGPFPPLSLDGVPKIDLTKPPPKMFR